MSITRINTNLFAYARATMLNRHTLILVPVAQPILVSVSVSISVSVSAGPRVCPLIIFTRLITGFISVVKV